MRVKFWGTRGSIAKPGAATARYGGNTSCVEIRSDSGTLIIIDCGTGAHDLGQHLIAGNSGAVDGHILISHTHWDHIQGLPFFAPLFVSGNTWNIYGPKGLSQSLETTLAGQMEHTYFPIALDQFRATIRYHDLVEGTFTINDVTIVTHYLNHPALTLGYRLEADGASVVYCCDHEPHSAALSSGESALTGIDRRHVDFVAGADLVIHDAQYTAREFAAKIGWGHSTAEYAVRVARDAGVKRVVLTHHDPLRDDAAVEGIIEDLRRQLPEGESCPQILAAAEGLSIELQGDPNSSSEPAPGLFPAKTAIDLSAATRPVLLYVHDSQVMAVLSEAAAIEGFPRHVVADDKELLRRTSEDQPSLIMVEHNPPHIDGQAIASAIRRVEGTDSVQVPIVLVAAAERLANRENSLVTDWLVAPFKVSYARARIHAWVLRTACRWIRAQTPAKEDQRLAALQHLAILDTPPDARFDRVTRIAASALGVPIALVSLIDRDRQWFKSCFGLNVSETSRDVAFCAHVVHQQEELVVPDTLQDDRFADNPLVVAAPHIRFYAGAPLILDDGNCIGTLCVVDTRPRELSQAELATLRDLRDVALEEIRRMRT
jgi:phosphoribosyl 1,2-cyclic phosphodiesterase/CheY-like chemotaxis protein